MEEWLVLIKQLRKASILREVVNDEMKERAPKTSWERAFIGEGTVFSKTLEWKLTGSKNSKECVAGLEGFWESDGRCGHGASTVHARDL